MRVAPKEAVPSEHVTTLGNIIVVSGALIILLFLVKKYAWGNIVSIFEKRAEKISNDISAAEAAKERAERLAKEREEKLAASHTEAEKILKNAKASGNASRENIILEATSEAKQFKEKVRVEIQQERAEAVASIKGEVADISVLIASKILGKELSLEAHQELINQYIDKLGEADGK
ncbi:MAG: F0F1 ATP synthase subunit B [Streptococcaceae bacterium]|nr:F0F1 ATP synthase subunit B [Streptococcaceae bacterium]